MIGRLIHLGTTLAVFVACLVAALGAQEAPEAFRPLTPGELAQEQLPAAPLVFAAYAFVWLALVAYVFMLWRRLTRVEGELADVSARLEAKRR